MYVRILCRQDTAYYTGPDAALACRPGKNNRDECDLVSSYSLLFILYYKTPFFHATTNNACFSTRSITTTAVKVVIITNLEQKQKSA